ncbi:hypothetical protein D9M71_390640 [compost metagenome]
MVGQFGELPYRGDFPAIRQMADQLFQHHRSLDKGQRVTAQFDEAEVGIDIPYLEYLRPGLGQLQRQRGQVLTGTAGACRHVIERRRQGPLVDLAVGRQRYGLKENEQRRHHIVRQLACERLTQLSRRHGLFCHAIGDQPHHRTVMVGQHNALFDLRMADNGAFDFRQFDPVAADLHLTVSAPQKTDTAIGKVGAKIAGPVTDVVGGTGKRVDHEFFPGQRCIPPVAQ